MIIVKTVNSTYRKAILSVYISEALDVVEDEPRQRDHHQHDERDRHEQHRSSAKVTNHSYTLKKKLNMVVD